MTVSLLPQGFCDPLGCLDPCFVIIQTERYLPQKRILLQHPEQRVFGHTAEGDIAVLLPSIWVQGDERQQINGGFERIQLAAGPTAMETVPGIAACHIPFEALAK